MVDHQHLTIAPPPRARDGRPCGSADTAPDGEKVTSSTPTSIRTRRPHRHLRNAVLGDTSGACSGRGTRSRCKLHRRHRRAVPTSRRIHPPQRAAHAAGDRGGGLEPQVRLLLLDLYSQVTDFYQSDNSSGLRAETLKTWRTPKGSRPIWRATWRRRSSVPSATMDVSACVRSAAWESHIIALNSGPRVRAAQVERCHPARPRRRQEGAGSWTCLVRRTRPPMRPRSSFAPTDGDLRGQGHRRTTLEDGAARVDFHYRRFHAYPDGETLWSTTARWRAGATRPSAAAGVLQRHRRAPVVSAARGPQGLRALGHEQQRTGRTISLMRWSRVPSAPGRSGSMSPPRTKPVPHRDVGTARLRREGR